MHPLARMLPILLAVLVAQTPQDVKLASELGIIDLAPSDESTVRRMVETTLPKVARVMGVSAPASVKLKLISREQARTRMMSLIERDYPGDRLERLGAALQRVGLLDPEWDLKQVVHELYSQHAGGFYDQHDGTLYLLDSQPMAVQSMVIPHELAHALQDRKLNLKRTIDGLRDSEDAQLALSAALEGHAQKVAALVLAADAGGNDDVVRALMQIPAASAELGTQGLPPWFSLQLGFPYSAGASLVEALGTADDPTASMLLERPPLSTAQVLDTSLYRSNEKPLKGEVGLGEIIDGTGLFVTTLGRANLDLLGRIHREQSDEEPLGKGWRGDRLEIIRTGETDAAVWVVAFRKRDEARSFAEVLAKLLRVDPEGEGWLSMHADGSLSAVIVRGSTVASVMNVPGPRASRLVEAAFSALK